MNDSPFANRQSSNVPKAVVFDFQDTLIAVKAAYLQANERLFQDLKRLGVALDSRSFYSALTPIVAEVKAAHARDPYFFDATSAFIHRLLEILKFPVPPDTFRLLVLNYDRKFADSVTLYTDAEIVLPRLKAAGFKLGLVVDGTVRRERRILERLNLERAFDVIIISEEAGENKITHKPLWLALTGLNVPPSAVIVVGDREDKDIAPAKALGCRAVRLARPSSRYADELKPTAADVTIHSLLELERLLRAWTFARVAVKEAV